MSRRSARNCACRNRSLRKSLVLVLEHFRNGSRDEHSPTARCAPISKSSIETQRRLRRPFPHEQGPKLLRFYWRLGAIITHSPWCITRLSCIPESGARQQALTVVSSALEA